MLHVYLHSKEPRGKVFCLQRVETLWLDLEERLFQDKHSCCCGTGTRDWGKGKNKIKASKDDEPASSQPLVRGCRSHNSLKGTRTKPSSLPPTTVRSESPRYCVGQAGNALSGGEMRLLLGCVRGWCVHRCPPAAITGCPCP